MTERGEIDVGRFEVSQLVWRGEFREYCAQNRCGNYGAHPKCPPQCGSFEELRARVMRRAHGVLLRTRFGNTRHNEAAAQWLAERIARGELPSGGELISAGPTPTASCMSAYCIDATALMKSVGMDFSWRRGEESYLTLYIYGEADEDEDESR